MKTYFLPLRGWRCLSVLVALTNSSAAIAQSTPPTLPDARLVNLSVRATLASNETLVSGFVVGGQTPMRVLLRAAGPSLQQFGVTDAMARPSIRVHGANGVIRSPEERGLQISNLLFYTQAVGAFPFAGESLDAATVLTLDPGVYTLHVTGRTSADTGTVLAEIYDTRQPAEITSTRLVNISARGRVDGAGLISGFVVTGQWKRFLIRAAGPALSNFQVTDAVSDVRLDIYDDRGVVAKSNDNWGDDSAKAAEVHETALKVRAFPFAAGSRDAAVVTPVPPGKFTVRASGVAGAVGSALIEIYELEN